VDGLGGEVSDHNIADCRYRQRFTVPFRDVDMFDHVNNVAYLTWCEDIRIRYFEEVVGVPIKGSPKSMIILRMDYHYLRQVGYRDEIILGARTSRFGTKSYDMHYEVWNETRQERAGYGLSVLVAFDYAANRSIPIPDEWRDRVGAYELVKPEEPAPAR
jgi:acyl-CoA thioester hydrolase